MEPEPGPRPAFWRPDNSAVFIASVTRASLPYVFRLACVLRAEVDRAALRAALAAVAPRFPYFMVELRAGLFWYWLEPVPEPPLPGRPPAWPCAPLDPLRRPRFLFRVFAEGRRICCEFHHVLADGAGGFAFLRALVAEYFARVGVACADYGDIARPGTEPLPGEDEDAYAAWFRGPLPEPPAPPPAFHQVGPRLRGTYRVTHGEIPLEPALAAARARGATVTELLAAAMLEALLGERAALPARTRRRAPGVVAIQIPVNLRKLRHSRTNRNCFLCADARVDARLGDYDFDELLEAVRHQLRGGTNEKRFAREIARNVGGERSLRNRPIPLVLKNLVLRTIGAGLADRPFSGSVSNVGAVVLPPELEALVERFEVTPARSPLTGANVTACSFAGRLVVTCGSVLERRGFERRFYGRLVRLGLPVRVSTNLP